MTLTEFLNARLDEDEAVARDAYYDGQRWSTEEEAVVSMDQDLDPVLFMDRKRDATHAARWSPARVLAEVEAKRRLVERHEFALSARVDARPGVAEVLSGVVRLLALPYADHPDYDEAWRP